MLYIKIYIYICILINANKDAMERIKNDTAQTSLFLNEKNKRGVF